MTDEEIIAAIEEWASDDKQGYDAAILLLCRIKEVLEMRKGAK